MADETLATAPPGPPSGLKQVGNVQLSEAEEKRFASFLQAELTRSTSDLQEYQARINIWREIVDPPEIVKNTPWPNASSFFAPFGRLVIDTIKAATKQTITRQKRRYVADIVSIAHAGIEREQENPLLRAAENFAEKVSLDPAYLNLDPLIDEITEEAFTTGIGVIKLIIENDSSKVKTSRGEKNVARHEGPKLYLVPSDTWVWPAGFWRSIQEMTFCGHTIQLTEAEIKRRASSPDWKYANIDKVIPATSSTASTDNIQQGEAQLGIQVSQKPVMLYDLSVCYDLFNNGEIHDLAVTFHKESGTILRIAYGQIGDGMKPYDYEVASPRVGKIPGRGVIEPIRSCIKAINMAVNQAFDSQTLANSPCVITQEDVETGALMTDGFVPGSPFTWKEDRAEIDILKFPDPSTATFQLVEFFVNMINQLTRVGPTQTGDVSASRRTPATLGLAIQQSGAELVNEYIDRLRNTIGRLMSRAFVLYYHHDPEIFVRLLGDEDGNLLRGVVQRSVDGQRSLNEAIRIRLSASSATRSVELERQNALATTQLTFGFYEKLIQLMSLILTPNTPPVAQQVGIELVKSAQEQMRRLVEMSDMPDAQTIIPDIAGLLEKAIQPPPGQTGAVPPYTPNTFPSPQTGPGFPPAGPVVPLQ